MFYCSRWRPVHRTQRHQAARCPIEIRPKYNRRQADYLQTTVVVSVKGAISGVPQVDSDDDIKKALANQDVSDVYRVIRPRPFRLPPSVKIAAVSFHVQQYVPSLSLQKMLAPGPYSGRLRQQINDLQNLWLYPRQVDHLLH